jgi:hypothetical protein
MAGSQASDDVLHDRIHEAVERVRGSRVSSNAVLGKGLGLHVQSLPSFIQWVAHDLATSPPKVLHGGLPSPRDPDAFLGLTVRGFRLWVIAHVDGG